MNAFTDLIDWFLRNDIAGKTLPDIIYSRQWHTPRTLVDQFGKPACDGWHQLGCGQIFYSVIDGCAHSLNDYPARIFYEQPDMASFTFFEKGIIHRSSGPARVGETGCDWFWMGTGLELDEWFRVCELSEEDKVLLKMQYG